MANHKSEIKRARQNAKQHDCNKAVKTGVKNIIKATRQSIAERPKAEAVKELNTAKSKIDKASKKGVIHKNTAARKISRLARRVNRIATS
ncbi:MAG: 30S ribosomal protein S20 [Desulfobacterales bacterium]|nr:30S ribosomal protein S20 [Desulfobacterales bacterium]